jgi:hypothetical protein
MGGFPQDPVFRGPAGGEDVAFMQAVMAHFQPIMRLERAGYRVWSQAGSHTDKFLSNTRLTGSTFEFVGNLHNQSSAEHVEEAIRVYLDQVRAKVSG